MDEQTPATEQEQAPFWKTSRGRKLLVAAAAVTGVALATFVLYRKDEDDADSEYQDIDRPALLEALSTIPTPND